MKIYQLSSEEQRKSTTSVTINLFDGVDWEYEKRKYEQGQKLRGEVRQAETDSDSSSVGNKDSQDPLSDLILDY